MSFVLLSAISLIGQSQHFEVKWPEEETNSKIPAKALIGSDTSGFYIYRQNNADDSFILLDRYHYSDFQRVSSTEIALPKVGKRSTRLEKIIFLNDHFLLFTSFYDKGSDLNRAFASLLDTSGNIIKSMFEVDRIENVTSKKNTGSFSFQLSPDSSLVLAFHNTPYRESENARFSVKLFDNKLNEKWQKKFKMPYADQNFEVVNALVDNDESVFMICRLFGEDLFRTGEMNASKKYTLFHYNHSGRKLTEYEINVDDNWIHSARFELVNDTTLVGAGFYSGSGQGNISGVFNIRLNTRTGELANHGFEDLPRDVILDVTYNDDLLFGGLASFELRKMLTRNDGTIVLVAEKAYVSTSTYFDPYTGQRLTTYYYHNDDVIVASVTPGGKIEWTTIIAKNQSTSSNDDRYSSVAVNLYDESVFILFNDHPQNLNFIREPGEIKTVSNFNKAIAVVASLDRVGSLIYKPLFPDKDPESIIQPRFSRNSETRRQLIYGERNGKDKFGEIFYRTD